MFLYMSLSLKTFLLVPLSLFLSLFLRLYLSLFLSLAGWPRLCFCHYICLCLVFVSIYVCFFSATLSVYVSLCIIVSSTGIIIVSDFIPVVISVFLCHCRYFRLFFCLNICLNFCLSPYLCVCRCLYRCINLCHCLFLYKSLSLSLPLSLPLFLSLPLPRLCPCPYHIVRHENVFEYVCGVLSYLWCREIDGAKIIERLMQASIKRNTRHFFLGLSPSD